MEVGSQEKRSCSTHFPAVGDPLLLVRLQKPRAFTSGFIEAEACMGRLTSKYYYTTFCITVLNLPHDELACDLDSSNRHFQSPLKMTMTPLSDPYPSAPEAATIDLAQHKFEGNGHFQLFA